MGVSSYSNGYDITIGVNSYRDDCDITMGASSYRDDYNITMGVSSSGEGDFVILEILMHFSFLFSQV